MNVLCVIPARAGSKRIPRKNWQEIAGSGLAERAYTTAVISGACSRVVVSSDSSDWPDFMDVIHRPADLSQGEPDSLARTVRHALQECEKDGTRYDYVVTLQPATPLRTPQLVRFMVKKTIETDALGAISMAKTVPWTWKIDGKSAENAWYPAPYPLSQDCNFTRLQEVNTCQIGRRDVVLSGKRWGLPLLVCEMPPWAVLDIDTPEELEDARALFAPLYERMAAIEYFPMHLVHSINRVRP